MIDWAAQVIAFLPNASWFYGSKLAGDHRRIGWLVLFLSEALWVWLSVITGLWTIIPWCVVGFVLYGRNYLKWKREDGQESPETTVHT